MGGDEVVCPSGSVNAGKTIRTVNCGTVVAFDGRAAEGTLAVQQLTAAGMKHSDLALREVDQAATDAQIEFSQLCEAYNACNLSSEEYRQRLDQTQAHLRAIRDKIELLRGAQGNPELLRQAMTDLYVTAVSPAKQAQTLLGLELVMEARTRDGTTLVLRGGETLHTGDEVVFGLRVSQPVYAYVFQHKGADPVLDVLFPNAKISGLANPIPAAQRVRIPPAGQVFTLDDRDLGQETVYIAVSLSPLNDLDAALRQAASGNTASPPGVATAVTSLFVEGAPECTGQTRGLTVTSSRGCGSMSRGLDVTPATGLDPFFGSPASVAARSLPGDDAILKTISFVHAE